MENKENTRSASTTTPKRIRFSSDDDLALLREVVNINPLQDPTKWSEVKELLHQITGKLFTERSLKDHLHLLLDLWLKKDINNIKKSGIEEIYSEKDHLLQEIATICKEFKVIVKKKKENVSRNQKIINLGKETRDACAKSFCEKKQNTEDNSIHDIENRNGGIFESNIHDYCLEQVIPNDQAENDEQTQCIQSVHQKLTSLEEEQTNASKPKSNKQANNIVLKPSGMRQRKSNVVRKDSLKFVEERSLRDYNLKIRELELEERKIAQQEKRFKMDEERFSLEAEERRFRLELEQQRFKREVDNFQNVKEIIEQQKTLINILLKKLSS